ncbi:uncharacterized protein YALI1_F02389g [Yarrowia lipolytica]|uniref:Uncharacterized protein n=1 Tax=Yarrowia lipolytica TaxID=4952 RepID=A0A1D8NLI3_YARLL|nr:hypothetical protein YALI1_F02389g [Yarrowia lipolytica]
MYSCPVGFGFGFRDCTNGGGGAGAGRILDGLLGAISGPFRQKIYQKRKTVVVVCIHTYFYLRAHCPVF